MKDYSNLEKYAIKAEVYFTFKKKSGYISPTDSEGRWKRDFEKKSLGKLKLWDNEMNAVLNEALSEAQKIKLKELSPEVFADLKTADDKKKRRIENALKKGSIRTDSDYRLLNEKIDEICQLSMGNFSPEQTAMIQKLEMIMETYASNKGKK